MSVSLPSNFPNITEMSDTDDAYVDEDARPMAAKYLTKWRPGFIESQSGGGSGNDAPYAPAVAA